MKIYKNEVKPIGDLIPYAGNSRTHSEEQIIQIASSIKEFGFTNPVLIDEDGGVIAGHGRILAAKKLDYKELPCIVLDGLTEAQKKAYVIADNQLALNSGWDIDMLKLEIDGLKELDFNVDLLGFDDGFLDGINEVFDGDYSDKNKELDLDGFDDEMILKFNVSKEQYDFISERLSNINESKEIALLSLLEYEA